MKKKSYQSLSEISKLQNTEKRYQSSVRPRYQERVWISEYQHQIYRAGLLGLKAFTKAELYKMSIETKRKIVQFYERVQRILNRWKQQLMNEMFEELCSIQCEKFEYNPFQKVFDDTVIGMKKFGKAVDDTFECTLTFAQLKITREQIIQKLIDERILPKNFYQIQKQHENIQISF
jgi:hypothetical protein